ncbi:MAG: DUF86 domain-containing protein [Endomicrobiales bacterium]
MESFVGKMSFKKFISDKKTVNAVIRSIEVIGEATKNLSSEFRKKYPEIPWKNMAGMRDKLIHEYFGIDNEILWMVIKKDLPSIKDEIREITKHLNR